MLEIVTHCYSGPDVPIYHRLLQLQLSSLLLSPPSITVTVSVFHSPRDERTKAVLQFFHREFLRRRNLVLQSFSLPRSRLFRRAIGRQQRALQSQADVLWFTDCDYLFLGDCLERAHAESLAAKHPLIFPQTVHVHGRHGDGDTLIAELESQPLRVAGIDRSQFVARPERKAIGGIQIARGDWCRAHGYLPAHSNYLKPVDPTDGFCSCLGDRLFRQRVGGSQPVEIPGVYRVRHSRCGRDNGSIDHGEKRRRRCAGSNV